MIAVPLLSIVIFSLAISRNYNIKRVNGYNKFEFGTKSIGDSENIINNNFILIALLYIIFDIEILFYFIYATVDSSNIIAFSTITIFTLLLIIALLMELKRGLFNWSKY